MDGMPNNAVWSTHQLVAGSDPARPIKKDPQLRQFAELLVLVKFPAGEE